MKSQVGFDKSNADRWHSVRMAQSVHGYSVRETPDRFATDAMTELVCRSVGMVLVIAAYAQLLLPSPLLIGDPQTARAALLLAFSVAGLAVYASATLGFRKQIKVDLTTRRLTLSKLNGRGNSRIALELPFADIESLYVKRPGERGGQAALYARKRGIPSTVCLLRGREGEISALHGRLCRELRVAIAEKSRRSEKARLFSRRAAGLIPA